MSVIPYANEFNINVDRESALERVGLLPPDIVCTGVHLVRKRNLLEIACREEADLTGRMT
jgi:hypothetical protein